MRCRLDALTRRNIGRESYAWDLQIESDNILSLRADNLSTVVYWLINSGVT